MDASTRRDRLSLAYDRAASAPQRVKVRTLVGWFGASRRGYRVVDRIRAELKAAGLATEPDFASAHIDSTVRLVRRAATPNGAASAAGEAVEDDTDVQLRVSSLKAASSDVLAVSPDDTIQLACSLMAFNDYSQLAVIGGPHTLKGYVSWETIGRSRLRHEPAKVREAMNDRPEVVSLDNALLPILARVAFANFVFVQARDRTLCGIITAADITIEFGTLASPYLLMGEIERRLRRIVDGVCPSSEMNDLLGPDRVGGRAIKSAEDLTLGELARLLERPDVWARLRWRVDRAEFGKQLEKVRIVRNDLMHFAEEPPSDTELGMLRSFNRTLAGLHVV